jgi:hypothetical protein
MCKLAEMECRFKVGSHEGRILFRSELNGWLPDVCPDIVYLDPDDNREYVSKFNGMVKINSLENALLFITSSPQR